MAKFKVIERQGQIGIRCKISSSESINSNEILYFSQHYIRGFMQPTVEDAGRLMFIGAQGVPLSRFLRNPIGKDHFFMMAAQIMETYKSAVNNGLNPQNIVFDPDNIIIDSSSGELFFVYATLFGNQPFNGGCGYAMNMIASGASYATQDDYNAVSSFLGFVNSNPQFSVTATEEYIMNVSPVTYSIIPKQEFTEPAPAPVPAAPDPAAYVQPADPYAASAGYGAPAADPYAAPAGYGAPAAAPYAAPAGYGAPAADPYAAPAGYGAPAADPYAAPAGYGAPAADPYAAPAGYGAPAADPYAAPAGYGAPAAPTAAEMFAPGAMFSPSAPETATAEDDSRLKINIGKPAEAPAAEPAVNEAPGLSPENDDVTTDAPTIDRAEETSATLPVEEKAPEPVFTRRSTGETFVVDKPVYRIGKERAKVDLCITDNKTVSRVHATVHFRGGECFLTDNNSTNRTFINGNPVPVQTEIKLKGGDVIKFSNEEFDFTF
ncbi:MAG: FHA domain-containing protein [Ruminococcus sp.]|nr:FHA domain-containing protein [Ruminococcus sp.]